MMTYPIDWLVYAGSFMGWLLFIIFHVALVRWWRRDSVALCIATSALISIAAVIIPYWMLSVNEPFLHKLFLTLAITCCTVMGISSYILIIFGVAYSSVRVHIMMKMKNENNLSTRFSNLHSVTKLFPLDQLVHDRLGRFLQDGVVKKVNNTFRVVKSERAFTFHGFCIRLFRRLYGL